MTVVLTTYLLIIFGLGIVGSSLQVANKTTDTPGLSLTNIFLSLIAIGAVLYLAGN
jgi:hypothetical protein